jgi:type II secretory pathway pseudopilin PulG
MWIADGARRASTPRTGAVLLEVVVALTILVTAGATLIALASESTRAVRHAHAAAVEMREANALFEAVALWPRADLDRHLGERAQGRWRMRVDRPTPTLYVVMLTDSVSNVEVLRTALFRPEPSGAGE